MVDADADVTVTAMVDPSPMTIEKRENNNLFMMPS
jgi:hypothetical protein